MTDVVGKLWGFCHTLRHDGVDYGDYIEQLTYLLFLKMADERGIELPDYTSSTKQRKVHRLDWPYLRKQSGTDLLTPTSRRSRTPASSAGMLGDIFAAPEPLHQPGQPPAAHQLIDETDWTALDTDVKAAAFEGLLEKAAAEGKKGAGQYFTPRPLIQSMVRCIKPDPRASKEFTIDDPACGTGGFLVAAYEWLKDETGAVRFDRDCGHAHPQQTYFGQELVQRPRRLALMNMYLHQVEPHITLGDSIYESPSNQRYDVVLTNPPFGTKGANQAPVATTSSSRPATSSSISSSTS